jgi:hypothetical protein
MPNELLLVGSLPYETSEEVFRNFGAPLGQYLGAMPDGEVGERRWWVQRVSYQVFNGHPELATITRPIPDNGIERLVPQGQSDFWQFQIRDGVDAVRFGNPGWRLGFARDAIDSYFVFRTMREQGVLPRNIRFQVCFPSMNSVVRTRTFPRPGDVERVRPGYEAALLAEVETVLKKIPAGDLVLQFDIVQELIDLYGATPQERPNLMKTYLSHLSALAHAVPAEVGLGFHLCFGTFGGWPMFDPNDLAIGVALANEILCAARRHVDYVHLPTLDRTDDAFYAPLSNLNLGDSKLYLGLIHHMTTFKSRLELARRYAPPFGLGAYCGLGRSEPAILPSVLQDHLSAVEIAYG